MVVATDLCSNNNFASEKHVSRRILSWDKGVPHLLTEMDESLH